MKTVRLLGVLALGMFLVGTQTRAESPIQLALAPPNLQLVSEEDSVIGLRLAIYGRNQNMQGVDIGFIHETKTNFKGLGFGLLNICHGRATGLQLAGIYNESSEHISGAQFGFVNRAGNGKGIQIGLVNLADDWTGFQLGLFNQIKSKDVLPVLPIINAAF